MQNYIYFRNDDVNRLDRQLVDVTELFIEQEIPIIHAVEPANVESDTVEWLICLKRKYPRLVEIMQHGFDHKRRDLGEFGGNRPYEDQLRDLSAGKRIMEEKFGEHFLNAVNFPFGPYNRGTIKAVNELKFAIVSSHFNYRLSRRAMYAVGRVLKQGQIFGKHVSHHMRYYPGTDLFDIDMSLSFIKTYTGGYDSTDCIFYPAEHLFKTYALFARYTNVIGFLIHHRYHKDPKSLGLLRDTIMRLKNIEQVAFTNYSELYERYAKS